MHGHHSLGKIQYVKRKVQIPGGKIVIDKSDAPLMFPEQNIANSKFSCLFCICCSGNSLHVTESLLVPVSSTLFWELSIVNRLYSSCSQYTVPGSKVMEQQ